MEYALIPIKQSLVTLKTFVPLLKPMYLYQCVGWKVYHWDILMNIFPFSNINSTFQHHDCYSVWAMLLDEHQVYFSLFDDRDITYVLSSTIQSYNQAMEDNGLHWQ